MGGSVSAGENNDDLIDNLVEANYIISKEVTDCKLKLNFYYFLFCCKYCYLVKVSDLFKKSL